MAASEEINDQNYHSTGLWNIGFFALNNTATNIYLFTLTFLSYYATGIAGLTVAVVSIVLTAMRAFDGITDPIIGFIIDKTESKFGKFIPVMVLGNIILIGSTLLMFNMTHILPESLRMPFFILIHAIYILGYTMQTTVTRAGQTVLTNHPKQRPLFSIFDSVYNIGVFTGGQVYVATYLVGKHGDFTLSLFHELVPIAVITAAVFTVLASIALWSKDRPEYYGLADMNVNVRFRDYWPVLKGNRPLQMLVIAASSDKLAGQVMQQQPVLVMLFGIMLGDYALSGTVSLIIIIPSLIITFLGVSFARRRGMKKALVTASWLGVISFALLTVFLISVDSTSVSISHIGFITIVFLVLYSIGRGIMTFTPSIVIPMIPDVADYETYKSGRYVPGMISTLFSFVDKVVSSLAPAIVGFFVALIGYKDAFPQIGEALTTPLLVITLVVSFGIPIAGWLTSIIAMKFYRLDTEKMKTIQSAIAVRKQDDNEETDLSNLNSE